MTNFNKLINRQKVNIALAGAILFLNTFTTFANVTINEKARIIATTDGELDDRSTMVRFLMYASDYDIEGIVQVNGVQKDGHSSEKWIEALIEKYGECLPNLKIHNPNYPDTSYLMSVLKVGNENRADLGKDPSLLSDSEGAQLIMKVLMDDDPRPVHILAWGGANTQANALWQIKTKYPDKWPAAAAKARLYCIWYQDGGGDWIEKNLPEIKIFEAGAPEHDGSWRYVWDYMSVDMRYKKRMSANPKELQVIMDSLWLYEHIKLGHGSLAAAYPQVYTSEGDSPSFMPCVDNGLEQFTDYTLGGWGGRSIYEKEGKNHLIDGADENNGKPDLHYTYQRWLPAIQNDWASRADWCIKSNYAEANHQPIVKVKGDMICDVIPGQLVSLDASGSSDPDGNTLFFKWWQYFEADNAKSKLTINNDSSQNNASFVVPNEPGKQLQIILEVSDNGEPKLTRYQRIIYNIIDNSSSINNIENQEIKIFPNPILQVLNIEINTSLTDSAIFQIFNQSGKLVFEKIGSIKTSSIDLSDFKSGIYFINVISNEKCLVKRFMKQ